MITSLAVSLFIVAVVVAPHAFAAYVERKDRW